MTTARLKSAAELLLCGMGLAVALVLGAVWTAMAVADGDVTATAVRFTLAMTAGAFYLTLLRVARRGAS